MTPTKEEIRLSNVKSFRLNKQEYFNFQNRIEELGLNANSYIRTLLKREGIIS